MARRAVYGMRNNAVNGDTGNAKPPPIVVIFSRLMNGWCFSG
jgi:hypothetical protein